MLRRSELLNAVECLQGGALSLDDFEEWFRNHSRGMFGESPEILRACLTIDSAFAELSYGALTPEGFREELAEAVRPFVVDSSLPYVFKSTTGEFDVETNGMRPLAVGNRSDLHWEFRERPLLAA
jgi:hypothetical protein